MDVVIGYGDRQWGGHSLILKMRCRFFKDLIDSRDQETEIWLITLYEDYPSAVGLFLIFLYTQHLPSLARWYKDTSELGLENYRPRIYARLAQIAEKYGDQELMDDIHIFLENDEWTTSETEANKWFRFRLLVELFKRDGTKYITMLRQLLFQSFVFPLSDSEGTDQLHKDIAQHFAVSDAVTEIMFDEVEKMESREALRL